jgi:hypothetical protein
LDEELGNKQDPYLFVLFLIDDERVSAAVVKLALAPFATER